MRKYYVYLIESLNPGYLYIGHTGNIQDRVRRHNSNRVNSTKGSGPWRLIGFLSVESRSEAMKIEKYLKSLKSPEATKEYLKKYMPKI